MIFKRTLSAVIALAMTTSMAGAVPATAETVSSNKAMSATSSNLSIDGEDTHATKGDVNSDGKITDDDSKLLNNWLTRSIGDSELDLKNADVNLDGKVDIQDFVELSRFCKSIQIADGEGEYKNVYTPEPKARVILKSDENTETKMTEEMAELADNLKTPLAVYEYLYNNVNVEFYTGSRKGAIGTYEQNGGNDVDCASLLIAMLRYLKYDAEYVTGKIGVTEKQLLELTGTDSVDDALNIIGIHFKKVSKSSNYYYFTHTWVRMKCYTERAVDKHPKIW